jgi:hypothetical protein
MAQHQTEKNHWGYGHPVRVQSPTDTMQSLETSWVMSKTRIDHLGTANKILRREKAEAANFLQDAQTGLQGERAAFANDRAIYTNLQSRID